MMNYTLKAFLTKGANGFYRDNLLIFNMQIFMNYLILNLPLAALKY